jgi:hypothetical protein
MGFRRPESWPMYALSFSEGSQYAPSVSPRRLPRRKETGSGNVDRCFPTFRGLVPAAPRDASRPRDMAAATSLENLCVGALPALRTLFMTCGRQLRSNHPFLSRSDLSPTLSAFPDVGHTKISLVLLDGDSCAARGTMSQRRYIESPPWMGKSSGLGLRCW